ncbi:MAG: hypothetical protein IPI90_15970 [Saprospiraceae bacterium]|nr:hypothetical protein [Candidatus Vicinibacter affinis]
MRDFVNNMTHEFKTPISSIKISADVLLHHPLVEEDKRLTQYAQIIRDQNQRLNDQVEKVLQIAKMESSSFRSTKRNWIYTNSLNNAAVSMLSDWAMGAEACKCF